MQDISLGVAMGSATQISMFVVRLNMTILGTETKMIITNKNLII